MCFGPEKYTPGEWFWPRAAQSSVVVFEKYDRRTDYRSDTKIYKQCCFDKKRVVHPFWLQAEVVWWCRQCMVCIVLDINDLQNCVMQPEVKLISKKRRYLLLKYFHVVSSLIGG